MFNCLRAAEPLQGHSLLLTTTFPEIHHTHSIDLGRIKDEVDLRATPTWGVENLDLPLFSSWNLKIY